MANSKRKCTGCGDRFAAETMIKLPAGHFHTIDCATTYAQEKQQKARERQQAKARRQQQEERKADRKALAELNRKDVRWQHKQTQKAFNKMRVLEELLWFKERGLEPTCISCGNPLGGDQWCCGHFKTVGAQGRLRYDPRNAYLQHNKRCNMGLSGDIYGTKNTHGYIQGLKNRFGDEEGQAIIDYCETHTEAKKWTWEDLECMRKQFNCKIRGLRSLLGV